MNSGSKKRYYRATNFISYFEILFFGIPSNSCNLQEGMIFDSTATYGIIRTLLSLDMATFSYRAREIIEVREARPKHGQNYPVGKKL